MSRTYRRKHFNKKNRTFFREYYNSEQEVKRGYNESVEKGYTEKNEAYKFWGDSYMGIPKGVRQTYKRISFKELRQEFRIAQHNFVLAQNPESDIVLEKVKPRCVKWDIT